MRFKWKTGIPGLLDEPAEILNKDKVRFHKLGRSGSIKNSRGLVFGRPSVQVKHAAQSSHILPKICIILVGCAKNGLKASTWIISVSLKPTSVRHKLQCSFRFWKQKNICPDLKTTMEQQYSRDPGHSHSFDCWVCCKNLTWVYQILDRFHVFHFLLVDKKSQSCVVGGLCLFF